MEQAIKPALKNLVLKSSGFPARLAMLARWRRNRGETESIDAVMQVFLTPEQQKDSQYAKRMHRRIRRDMIRHLITPDEYFLYGFEELSSRGKRMFVGESGCGKSTLLRTLMMLMEENCQIDKGAVFFEETDLTKLSEKELRLLRGKDIVMIFQNAALASNPLHKIGHQFYETITSHSGKMSKKECYAKAEDILKKLKFKEPKRILNSYPFELSGGMNQRVALALAILMNPKLILADEPTSALDVTVQAQVIKQMRQLREAYRTAMLVVTHNMGVVAQLCDKVGVLYAGRIVEWGSVKDILEYPKHPYTQALISAIPEMNGEDPTGIPGSPKEFTKEEIGCDFAPRCTKAKENCACVVPEKVVLSDEHWALCPYCREE